MTRAGDQGDGTYVNPILCSDYSDPDPIAMGDDFYLTASSFNCMPGLPILHSCDLVNWTIAGHALERLPMVCYDQPCHGRGVWAPAFRCFDGRFWIFFGTPDEGIFMITAPMPTGPWSALHQVRQASGWIDPCPFWDDDGQAYLVHALAASRAGLNSVLVLHRMTPDGSRLLDDGHVVIDGHFHHPIVEGPKLYKRNGWYYIFAPAGGVKGGWQAVFRSRSLDGPYEDRIVLCQGNTDINGPHQGGWVQTSAGECWFLHFQDRGANGRVVHLQPMQWKDDWPLVGEQTKAPNVFEPVLRHTKPNVGRNSPVIRPQASDDFSCARLGLQWQWMANPNPAWYSLTASAGRLRLFSQGTPSKRCNWWQAGNLLLQKPQDMHFRATTHMKLKAAAQGDRAGLIMTGSISAALVVERTDDGWRLALYMMRDANQTEPEVVDVLPWNDDEAFLRLEMEEGVGRFSLSRDGKQFTSIGHVLHPRSAVWLGAKVGMFSLNPADRPSGGYADFSCFNYEAL